MSALDDIPTHDLNFFLHELRMRRLALMPVDAPVVLSGGAANQIYFDWFAQNYPGHVERHIAVEYFAPAPDPLPERCRMACPNARRSVAGKRQRGGSRVRRTGDRASVA